MDGLAIGIDLGTYNSCAAYAGDREHVQIIRSQYPATRQGLVFPSFLQFDALGNVVNYGENARLQMAFAPESVVWGVKRLIGRSFHEVEKELQRFAYPLTAGPDGSILIPIGGHSFTPVEISTMLLQWIKSSAEKFNPFIVGAVHQAVVTHPAYFDAAQIGKTKEAAEAAGFDTGRVDLIAEPVAAALSYGLQLDPGRPQFIMTIDWGAGTLDIVITALMLDSQQRPTLSEVRPARGDVALGGIDMDDLLLKSAVELYDLKDFQPLVSREVRASPGRDADILRTLEQNFPAEMRGLLQGISLPRQPALPQVDGALWGEFYQLRDTIEGEKIKLSGLPRIQGNITYQGKNQEINMARTPADCRDVPGKWIILEQALQPALAVFRDQVEFAIQTSGLPAEAIQHLLLVGGPMHMPCVRRVVAQIFARNRAVMAELQAIEERGFPVNPMEAVARGAALHARGAGPALAPGIITRDYGIIVGQQGEILIHEGDSAPSEASLNGALGSPGRPGQPVPIGLYSREVGPSGESFRRMGDYEFFPRFGTDGISRFIPSLKAASDKTISLAIADLLKPENSRVLDKLSLLDGHSIPRPYPIPQQTDVIMEGKGIGPGPAGDSLVPVEIASRMRRSAAAYLQLAASRRGHPLVQANTAVKNELEQRMHNLEKSLRQLPNSGPVDQDTFNFLANDRMELIAFLQVHKLLSDEEKNL